MRLIDAHGHINDEKFDDVIGVVARAKENGLEAIMCASCNLSSSQKAVKFASEYENVYANVGFHPENVDEMDENSLKEIEVLANNKKVVAIGEIGLDYYWRHDNKEKQKEVFVSQIELANKLNLPVVIHTRDAMGDTLEILRQHKLKRPSLMHCYGGSIESATELIKLGFSFSFGGLVTFKNAVNVVEVVKKLPIEHILLETDCPYMTPVPFRGEKNEPKNVVYVADTIARIKGLSIEEVAEITTENAKRMFNI